MNKSHLKNIQDVIEKSVAEKKVAGMNVLIFKDGKEEGYFEAGMADIEAGKKYQRDTICRMYSMTKTVTSVAAWTLIEKGLVDIGEEVWCYLPEFRNVQVCTDHGRNAVAHKAFRPLLVQDLLNMTSGYGYGAWSDDAPLGDLLTSDLVAKLNESAAKSEKDGGNSISTKDFSHLISKIPLSFEPGSEYQYGFSADILGALIERVTGVKFSDYLKKTIFQPLGMTDTDFWVPAEKQGRLSKVYRCVEESGSGEESGDPNFASAKGNGGLGEETAVAAVASGGLGEEIGGLGEGTAGTAVARDGLGVETGGLGKGKGGSGEAAEAGLGTATSLGDPRRHLELFNSPNLGIHANMERAPAFESGGAGLCSTIDDYMKFGLMLANGGILDGHRILQESTVRSFTQARLRENLQKSFDIKMEHLSGYTYCNLFRVAYEKGKCKTLTENGEFGWDGWLGPFISVDLKNKLVMMVTMQRCDSGLTPTTRKIKNIVYSAL